MEESLRPMPGPRLPQWMRRPVRESEKVLSLKKILREFHLHTVCQSAGCPNVSQCFEKPTATFMILGNVCTRRCRFCGVSKGTPGPVDPDEPRRIAEAVNRLGLRHVVITSVTRDDLKDGGAGHFSRTVAAVRLASPRATIETLIPDFGGRREDLEAVLSSPVDILNHNLETVPRLYPTVRPQADYRRSLDLLERVKGINSSVLTKSGLMVGLGETAGEMETVFHDLAGVRCDALTIGQYLAPSAESFPVDHYVDPEQFDRFRESAERIGIPRVASGPYVRSSYNAESMFPIPTGVDG